MDDQQKKRFCGGSTLCGKGINKKIKLNYIGNTIGLHLIKQLINQSCVSNCYILRSFFLDLVILPINLAQKGNLLSMSTCLLLHYLCFLSIIQVNALKVLHCFINSYRVKTQSCNLLTKRLYYLPVSCVVSAILLYLATIS